MKKSVGFVVIFIVSTLLANAQEKNFGLIGGLNLANIRGDRTELINNSWRIACHFGVFSNFSLSGKLTLEPRILFSSKGYGDEIDFGLLNEYSDGTISSQRHVKYANRNSYLSVPLLLKYNLANKVSLDIGPEIAFLIYSKEVITKVDEEGFYMKGDVPQEGSGNFFIDYGAMAGVTFYFTDEASIQLNYFHGLSNLDRKSVLIDSTQNNSVFQLSLGYLIF